MSGNKVMKIKIEKIKVIPTGAGLAHEGEVAALGISENGYKAWGFGVCENSAKESAVAKVEKLIKSNLCKVGFR